MVRYHKPGPLPTVSRLHQRGVKELRVFCRRHGCPHEGRVTVEMLMPRYADVPYDELPLKCKACGHKVAKASVEWPLVSGSPSP